MSLTIVHPRECNKTKKSTDTLNNPDRWDPHGDYLAFGCNKETQFYDSVSFECADEPAFQDPLDRKCYTRETIENIMEQGKERFKSPHNRRAWDFEEAKELLEKRDLTDLYYVDELRAYEEKIRDLNDDITELFIRKIAANGQTFAQYFLSKVPLNPDREEEVKQMTVKGQQLHRLLFPERQTFIGVLAKYHDLYDLYYMNRYYRDLFEDNDEQDNDETPISMAMYEFVYFLLLKSGISHTSHDIAVLQNTARRRKDEDLQWVLDSWQEIMEREEEMAGYDIGSDNEYESEYEPESERDLYSDSGA